MRELKLSGTILVTCFQALGKDVGFEVLDNVKAWRIFKKRVAQPKVARGRQTWPKYKVSQGKVQGWAGERVRRKFQ